MPERPGGRQVSIVERVYSRIAGSGVPTFFLIPDNDEELSRHLHDRKLPFFTGSEEDVRERYRKAAEELQLDVIVRATADNPFTDPDHIGLTLKRQEELGCDLFSFHDLPLGVAVEVFTKDALMTDTAEDRSIYREHVSLHIKHHVDRFSVVHESSPVMASWRKRSQYTGPLPRLTVDEQRDYDTLRQVSMRPESATLPGLLQLFLKEPDLFAGNRDVEQRRFNP